MEKTYEFEIHFDGKEMETSIGATDIVSAIFNVIDEYRLYFNIELGVDNFVLIGEKNA